MDALANPFLLSVVVVLSTISFFFCWKGFREKDVPLALIGIGTSIPTFNIRSFNCWFAAAGVCALAYWLKQKIDYP